MVVIKHGGGASRHKAASLQLGLRRNSRWMESGVAPNLFWHKTCRLELEMLELEMKKHCANPCHQKESLQKKKKCPNQTPDLHPIKNLWNDFRRAVHRRAFYKYIKYIE